MFRVREKEDGTFDVFDSSTGNLAMVVTKENKENRQFKLCSVSAIKADQMIVQLLSSVNSNATNVCRTTFFPIVTLQNINVCEPMSKRRETITQLEASPKVDTRCPAKMSAEVADLSDDEYDCIDQDTFMKFFGLSSTKEGITSVKRLELFRQRHDVSSVLYPRIDLCDVDISSNLGQVMRVQSIPSSAPTENPRALISKYEIFCHTSNRRLGNLDSMPRKTGSNYVVTYPTKRQRPTHLYVFNRRQRLQQYRRLKTGLTRRSRRLAKLCVDCTVSMNRLTNTQIQNCCQNVWSEPELVKGLVPSTSISSTNTRQGYGQDSISHIDETTIDVCIDGTIVIEIDEFGSETVTVTQKPSKMINHHTGHPWLSPRKIFANAAAAAPQHQRGFRSVLKPGKLNNRFLESAQISIEPVAGPVRNGGNNTADEILNPASRSAVNSDSEDSEIEFIGSVRVTVDDINKNNNKKKNMYPVVTSLLTSASILPSKTPPAPSTTVNGSDVCSSGDAIFNPLDLVRATYEDEDWTTTTTATDKSPMDKVNLRKNSSHFPVHQVEIRDVTSDKVTSNLLVGTLPSGDHRVPDEKESSSLHANRFRQAEINLISNLVTLGGTLVDTLGKSSAEGERFCTLVCHICHVEETYEANAVGRIHEHMTNHGGLGRASLVSNLEYRCGERIIVLQAFPLDAVAV